MFLLPYYTNILLCFFLFATGSEEPEVFLPKYFQTAIRHAAHFRRVVKQLYFNVLCIIMSEIKALFCNNVYLIPYLGPWSV